MLIGIVGKPSSGKSTFFNALSGAAAKVGDYPFTTIEPNVGVGFVEVQSVCKEFGIQCRPRKGECTGTVRFVPVDLIDVAGLVPGASEGKGLGNKFLDSLQQADALIHVVDSSGSLDSQGKRIEAGSWDPIDDIEWLELELAAWYKRIIDKSWTGVIKKTESEKVDIVGLLLEKLSGLKIKRNHIHKAMLDMRERRGDEKKWGEEELLEFAHQLRKNSKPILIAANKVDTEFGKQYFQQIQKKYQNTEPVSALSELALQKLKENNLIMYSGGKDLALTNEGEKQLTNIQKSHLAKIQESILGEYGSTGIVAVVTRTVFSILDMITVFPVEDQSNLCDKEGNPLPDAILLEKGTNVIELAGKIHTDLAKGFRHAILVRKKQKIGRDYELKDRDIIKIVVMNK